MGRSASAGFGSVTLNVAVETGASPFSTTALLDGFIGGAAAAQNDIATPPHGSTNARWARRHAERLEGHGELGRPEEAGGVRQGVEAPRAGVGEEGAEVGDRHAGAADGELADADVAEPPELREAVEVGAGGDELGADEDEEVAEALAQQIPAHAGIIAAPSGRRN